VKGTPTIEQRALMRRIDDLKISNGEKRELKRLLLLLVRIGG